MRCYKEVQQMPSADGGWLNATDVCNLRLTLGASSWFLLGHYWGTVGNQAES